MNEIKSRHAATSWWMSCDIAESVEGAGVTRNAELFAVLNSFVLI